MSKVNYENILRYIDNTMVPYLKRNFSLMLLGSEIAGQSHVCEKHVALDKEELEKRLRLSELHMASSFENYDAAESYIKRILFDEGIQCDIAEWLYVKKEEMLEISLFTEDDPVEVTGYGVKDSGRVLSAFNVRLVIRRDKSELGWHIVTAYPIDFMPVDYNL